MTFLWTLTAEPRVRPESANRFPKCARSGTTRFAGAMTRPIPTPASLRARASPAQLKVNVLVYHHRSKRVRAVAHEVSRRHAARACTASLAVIAARLIAGAPVFPNRRIVPSETHESVAATGAFTKTNAARGNLASLSRSLWSVVKGATVAVAKTQGLPEKLVFSLRDSRVGGERLGQRPRATGGAMFGTDGVDIAKDAGHRVSRFRRVVP